MTLIAQQTAVSTSYNSVEIWGLANPDAGTYSASVTSGSGSWYPYLFAMSLNGVKQDTTGAVNDTDASYGNSSTFSNTVTTTVDDCALIAHGYHDDPVSVGANTTLIYTNTSANPYYDLIARYNPLTTGTAGTYTMNYSGTGTDQWASLAVALEPAPLARPFSQSIIIT